MATRKRRKLGAEKLLGLQPRSVQLSQEELVDFQPLREGEPLPFLATPKAAGIDLLSWITHHREKVESMLLECGGVLFRGFDVAEVSDMQRLVEAMSPQLLEYRERSAPRTHMEGRVYTSTEYPADQQIAFHNEFSYAFRWPLKICFYCVKAAEKGGATPIADSRKVYALLDPKLRQKFEDKGVMYVRNYGGGIDLPWQEVFQTDDREKVEDYCRQAPMEFEWRDGDRLRTRALRPATAVHPTTGETVWFNQSHLFHVSNLEASVRAALADAFAEEDLPRTTFYGDGSPIEVSALDEIRAAYEEAAVRFPWQEGDLLLLENMMVAHARDPFVGSRTIAVAMADPYDLPQNTTVRA